MGRDNERGLDGTPTWAIAGICAVIIAISLVLESILHRVSQWLSKKRNQALLNTLDKVKSELMTLGFMSLLLTFTGQYVSFICIPAGAATTMLPCRTKSHRRNLSAADPTNDGCPKGMVPLVPPDALHQLHIFLFFLAVFHVAFSAITLYLGRAKMRVWKEWENETRSPTYKFLYDPSKVRLAHQTTFVMRHVNRWSKSIILLYIVSFFRQFFRSVRRTDYLTLRHGFIVAHLSPGASFNFQKYIKRSLEDDFKTVVDISPPLWASALAVLLINVHGSGIMFLLSTVRLVVVLSVGTKLHAIIATMAIEIKEKHTIIQGMPVVKLSDGHFWFGKPRLVLHIITFASFQNAFEITHFFWIWYDFGWRSCFHENFGETIAGVCLSALLQFMFCYITLPLYALLSQMGSEMKRTIFDEQTAKALVKWRNVAVAKKKQPGEGHSDTREWQLEVPVPRLSRCKTIAHVGDRGTLYDSGHSDVETGNLVPPMVRRSLSSREFRVVDRCVEAALGHV